MPPVSIAGGARRFDPASVLRRSFYFNGRSGETPVVDFAQMDAFFVGLDALFRGDLMGTAGFTGETEEAPLVDGGPTGSSARVAGVLDQLG